MNRRSVLTRVRLVVGLSIILAATLTLNADPLEDTVELRPESAWSWTGTSSCWVSEPPEYRYWRDNGLLRYCHFYPTPWEAVYVHGFSKFGLAPIPQGRRILTATFSYFQNHAGNSRTELCCAVLDPPRVSDEDLFNCLHAAPRASSVWDTIGHVGWIARDLNAAGLYGIQSALRTGNLTMGIRAVLEGEEGRAHGYDSANVPCLLVSYSGPFEAEAAATAILSPGPEVGTADTIYPRAVVRNQGTAAQEIPVVFRIGHIYRDTRQVLLASGQTDTVEFAPWCRRPAATFQLACSTQLVGDSIPEDDTITGSTLARTSIDVRVASVDSPAAYVDSGQTVVPIATIENLGIRHADLQVAIRIGDAYFDTAEASIAPGGIGRVRFSPWHAVQVDTWPVRCTTRLERDENPGNNALWDTVEVVGHATLDTVRVGIPDLSYWTGYAEGYMRSLVGDKYSGSILTRRGPGDYANVGWAKFLLSGVREDADILDARLSFYVFGYDPSTLTGFGEVTTDPVTSEWHSIISCAGGRICPDTVLSARGWHTSSMTPEGIGRLSQALPRGWFATSFHAKLGGFRIHGVGCSYVPYLELIGHDIATGVDVSADLERHTLDFPVVAGQPEYLSVWCQNHGGRTARDVKALVYTGGICVASLRLDALAPCERRLEILPFTVDSSLFGISEVYAVLRDSADQIAHNDTADVGTEMVFPLGTCRAEGFERHTFPPPGCVVVNNDTATGSWVRLVNEAWAHSDSSIAACEIASEGNDDWLITSGYNVSTRYTDNVGFFYAARTYHDPALLEVWILDGQSPADTVARVLAGWVRAGYNHARVCLDDYDGSTVFIGFRDRTPYGQDIVLKLDDIYFQRLGQPGQSEMKPDNPAPFVGVMPTLCRNQAVLRYNLPVPRCILDFFSVDGRVVRSRAHELADTRGTLPLDLEELACGVYLLRIRSGSFASSTKLVIH